MSKPTKPTKPAKASKPAKRSKAPKPTKVRGRETPDRDDSAAALVRDDIEAGLGGAFSGGDGFSIPGAFADLPPITGGARTAVVWEYHATHTDFFQGVGPTGRPVTIRGVTVVDRSGPQPLFHRYVDWLEVMGQLGLTSTHRPALDALPSTRPPRRRTLAT